MTLLKFHLIIFDWQQYSSYGNQYGASAKSTYGGWDKCLGPFDGSYAQENGIDVWECHSNCYVRRDPNGGKRHEDGV